VDDTIFSRVNGEELEKEIASLGVQPNKKSVMFFSCKMKENMGIS